MTKALRKLIGTRVHYADRPYVVIDVVVDEAALVLRECADCVSIQTDQHGRPYRRAADTFTVPLFTENREPNPELRIPL